MTISERALELVPDRAVIGLGSMGMGAAVNLAAKGHEVVGCDLREAARSYRLPLASRLRWLYLPGVFPYLVTGWVTAAGGAWNLSIVAEYVTLRDHVEQARGLGAMIADAFDRGPDAFPLLAASTLTLAGLVVFINRTLWRSLYQLAETRYTLVK